jgi:hypothetical protein
LLAAGCTCSLIGIVLSRQVRHGTTIRGEFLGLELEDLATIGLSFLGSVLIGMSLAFLVAGRFGQSEEEKT